MMSQPEMPMYFFQCCKRNQLVESHFERLQSIALGLLIPKNSVCFHNILFYHMGISA